MKDEELEISLADIAKELKKHIWLLVIVSLLATVAACGIYVFFTENVYTAQVKLYVLSSYQDSAGNTRFDMTASSSFASDFKELIRTNEILEQTCNRLGWEKWPADAEIDVAATSGTRIINIEVTHRDPQLAMEAANNLSEVFVDYVSSWMDNNTISLAAPAVLPEKPSNRMRIMMIPLALVGSFVAVAFILLAIRMLDNRVYADEDLSVSMQVNVLSRIEGYKPEMDAYLEQRMNRKMSLLHAVGERTQESIKKLALNLQFASMGDQLDVVTITSTTPSEGKSSIALMLACQFAKEGKNVLLVDMDYRSPMLGRYLGIRNRRDIFEYLGGRANFEDVVVRTRLKNLYFVDNGHRMTMMLTNGKTSNSLDRFIAEARSMFDLVIFDTPPLGMFIDAATLAAKSDGTIVVVADGKVKRNELEGVFAQLKNANARILGVAFNFVHSSENSYYYNKYYRYGEQHRDEREKTEDDTAVGCVSEDD